ncbi:hypothetical protein HWV62_31943 [Athelia sp. TMB]|nr:hypothetical protein HWV62_31943 [Athelia sp. TMB]
MVSTQTHLSTTLAGAPQSLGQDPTQTAPASRQPSPSQDDMQAPNVLADRTTWAKRNPTAKVQPKRAPGAKLSTAERARRKAATAERNERATRLHDDISEYLEESEEKYTEIAERHSVTVQKVKELITAKTYYKSKRAPSLRNAIVHEFAETINSCLPKGSKKSLAEIQAMIDEDGGIMEVTDERASQLIANLITYRDTKQTGVRANNRSASMDINAVCERITIELDNLADRTGYSAFFLGARNSVNDAMPPIFHGSGDAEKFFSECFGKTTWEVSKLFEQWLCKRETTIEKRDTVMKVRSECIGLIKQGLHAKTNNDRIEMNYVNYEEKIVIPYQVKLVGHPFGIKNPSDITTITDLRTLRNALKTKQCQWVRITDEEADALTKDIRSRRERGEVVGKPRAKRSDAGVARGSNKRSRNDENQDPSSSRAPKKRKSSGKKAAGKKTKQAKGNGKAKRAPTSSEFVEDGEDEEPSDDDDN